MTIMTIRIYGEAEHRKSTASHCMFLLIAFFCGFTVDAQLPDTWNALSDLPAPERQQAACFSAGGFGYVFTGIDSAGTLLADGYRYDPSNDTWTALAPFPGGSRCGAVGFAINDTGYLATGFDGTDFLKDCWQYIPATDSWTRIQDLGAYLNGSFPGRTSASAITANGKAYVLCGYDGSSGYLKQVLRFDPAKDTCWSVMANFANNSQGLAGRRWCSGFSIGNFIYLGTGYSFSQDIKKDFWRLDLSTNSWSQVSDFGGGFRSNAFAFSLYGKGYIGCGTDGGIASDLWRYDPASNSWSRVADFSGGNRMNTFSFTIGNKAYVGTGNSNLIAGQVNYFRDCWSYTPDSTVGLEEEFPAERLSIRRTENGWLIGAYENLPGKNESRLSIFTPDGRAVRHSVSSTGQHFIAAGILPPGMVLVRLESDGLPLLTGKIVF
ncbi:MAG: hypothetical protein RL021_1635 [Bacteroidota bacterium]|jgi:N-acetylneuraminic acid mutarotase